LQGVAQLDSFVVLGPVKVGPHHDEMRDKMRAEHPPSAVSDGQLVRPRLGIVLRVTESCSDALR